MLPGYPFPLPWHLILPAHTLSKISLKSASALTPSLHKVWLEYVWPGTNRKNSLDPWPWKLSQVQELTKLWKPVYSIYIPPLGLPKVAIVTWRQFLTEQLSDNADGVLSPISTTPWGNIGQEVSHLWVLVPWKRYFENKFCCPAPTPPPTPSPVLWGTIL